MTWWTLPWLGRLACFSLCVNVRICLLVVFSCHFEKEYWLFRRMRRQAQRRIICNVKINISLLTTIGKMIAIRMIAIGGG